MAEYNEREIQQWVANVAQMEGDSFGDVNEYGVWIGRIDLDPDSGDNAESAAIREWGQWLIVQQDSQGFITVVPFPDEHSRDRAYNHAEKLYAEWLETTDA